MKTLLILCAVVLLSACEQPVQFTPNQCIRAELFKQCMAILPAGPVATKYNDWAEVVDECESAAYHQSLRKTESIPMECRAR